MFPVSLPMTDSGLATTVHALVKALPLNASTSEQSATVAKDLWQEDSIPDSMYLTGEFELHSMELKRAGSERRPEKRER